MNNSENYSDFNRSQPVAEIVHENKINTLTLALVVVLFIAPYGFSLTKNIVDSSSCNVGYFASSQFLGKLVSKTTYSLSFLFLKK